MYELLLICFGRIFGIDNGLFFAVFAFGTFRNEIKPNTNARVWIWQCSKNRSDWFFGEISEEAQFFKEIVVMMMENRIRLSPLSLLKVIDEQWEKYSKAAAASGLFNQETSPLLVFELPPVWRAVQCTTHSCMYVYRWEKGCWEKATSFSKNFASLSLETREEAQVYGTCSAYVWKEGRRIVKLEKLYKVARLASTR